MFTLCCVHTTRTTFTHTPFIIFPRHFPLFSPSYHVLCGKQLRIVITLCARSSPEKTASVKPYYSSNQRDGLMLKPEDIYITCTKYICRLESVDVSQNWAYMSCTFRYFSLQQRHRKQKIRVSLENLSPSLWKHDEFFVTLPKSRISPPWYKKEI